MEFSEAPEKPVENLQSLGEFHLTEGNDRLTIRIDAYWESMHETPTGRHVVSAMCLDSCGVEPYIRKFKATEVPRKLGIGDIPRESVGYLLITNIEGTRFLETPTEEEREDILKRVAVIDGFEISPHGMPFLGRPTTSNPLMVHCRHGEALLQVCIFPR